VVTKGGDGMQVEPRPVRSIVELEPLVDARKAQEASS